MRGEVGWRGRVIRLESGRAAAKNHGVGTAAARERGESNDVDPEAWLADVLHQINGHPVSRLHELLPWN